MKVLGLGSTGEAEAEARAVLDRLVVVRVAQRLRGGWVLVLAVGVKGLGLGVTTLEFGI